MTDFMDKLDAAADLIKEHKFQDALSIYKEILNKQPDEPTLYECLSNIGFLYFENRQFDDAISILTEATQLPFTDHHAQLYKSLGLIYKNKRNFELAVEFLLESLDYMDDNALEAAYTKFECGKILLELNDLDLSYKYFKEIEPIMKDSNPEYHRSLLYFLGMNAYMKAEIELAESYFNVLLLDNDISENEKVHAYFGMIHVANSHKNADDIFKFASKILELEPEFYDKETLTYMMVKAYEYQNREQEFFAALSLFIKDYPNGRYEDEYQKLKDKEFNSIK